MEKIVGVYRIVNNVTNKMYIGQTVNFRRRVTEHKCDLKYNRHSNPELQRDYNKYGLNSFKFELLEGCSKTKLLECETYWINYYGGKESEYLYNKCDLSGHNKDYKHNQSIAQKGIHTISETGRLRISQANRGKIISEEQKQKIRQAAKSNPDYGMRNKKHSQYSKELMSKKKKGKYLGSNNPNYRYTPEFIEILRQEYQITCCYVTLARKYNINSTTVSRLIRYGKS